jgi:hypothetical protein
MSIQRRNDDGSFTVLVPISGEVSANGVAYKKTDIIAHLDPSSQFMKRLQHGGVKSELGYPVRTLGQSADSYWRRSWEIAEENVCCLITYARIDRTLQKTLEAELILTIRPVGPKGPTLEKMLADHVPLKFAIRGFTSGKVNELAKLTTLVTFDVVEDTVPNIDARVA